MSNNRCLSLGELLNMKKSYLEIGIPQFVRMQMFMKNLEFFENIKKPENHREWRKTIKNSKWHKKLYSWNIYLFFLIRILCFLPIVCSFGFESCVCVFIVSNTTISAALQQQYCCRIHRNTLRSDFHEKWMLSRCPPQQ